MQYGTLDDHLAAGIGGARTQPSVAGTSRLELLPSEILLEILALVSASDLARVAMTSRSMRRIALQDVLWKPVIARVIEELSPPVHGAAIQPVESNLPLWHPDFGLPVPSTQPSSWPRAEEFEEELIDDAADSTSSSPTRSLSARTPQEALDLDLFVGATSFHQVYSEFVQKCEPLLGWWASNLPFYGMALRVVFDPHFDDGPSHSTSVSSVSGPTSASSPPGDGRPSKSADKGHSASRPHPAFVCQRIHLTNRLQGLDIDSERWASVTGFPMPRDAHVIGSGTMLRTFATPYRTDLCEAGIRTENLWHFSWGDAQKLRKSEVSPANASTASSASSSSATPPELRATITSESWLGSLDQHNATQPVSEEDIDDVVQQIAVAPRLRALNFGFDFEIDDAGELPPLDIRRVLMQPVRQTDGHAQHLVYHLSNAVSTRPPAYANDGRVQVQTEAWQPYTDAARKNAAFASSQLRVGFPSPPTIFPPPSLLPVIRSPPRSNLGSRTIGFSEITEHMNAYQRWMVDGEGVTIDSLTMSPPPPFRSWPHQAAEEGLRFFPIKNPARVSSLPKPKVKRRQLSTGSRIAPSSSSSGFGSLRGNARDESVISYEHWKPPPSHDPAHVDFDWSLVEGLYSMTYGPHGMELLYIRARELTSLDFDPENRVPAWPAEPLLSDDDMYEQTSIDRHNAAKVGARVLEGVKVLGDPNIPRGQISWRAFIDDPGRSTTPWRPPLNGFRRHTPWPLLSPPAASYWEQDSGSPGLTLPAHGRVAAEGFSDPGWAPAFAHVSSLDEIQIWWQSMHKISIAKKLIGV